MEMEMRLAIDVSSSKKAPSPLGSGSGASFLGSSPCVDSSDADPSGAARAAALARTELAQASPKSATVLGTAEKTTATDSTMEMSSSSAMPTSSEASSSSRATPKDTEKAKSEPRAPSALAASLMAAAPRLDVGFAVSRAALRLANLGVATLQCRRADGAEPLSLRLLYVEHEAFAAAGAGPHRRARRAKQAAQHLPCRGAVVGLPLGALLAAVGCTRAGRDLRCVIRGLAPARAALAAARGADVRHLERGLFARRVLRVQAQDLRCNRGPRLDHRTAHWSVAVGITAAIFAFFCIRRLSLTDHTRACGDLINLLDYAWEALVMLKATQGVDADVHLALAAERRCVERAALGAHLTWARQTEDDFDEVLRSFRRAAWPTSDRVLDAATHEDAKRHITSGDFLADPEAPGGLPLGEVVALGALRTLPEGEREREPSETDTSSQWSG